MPRSLQRVPYSWLQLGLVIFLMCIAPAHAASISATAPDRARGEYLFKAAGCAGCHTDSKGKGKPLAGGHRLETPLGVFYTPNITADRATGIGNWSDADFIRALRDGVSPRGEHYYPAFPYTSYTRLSDEDMRAIKAYIFSLPAAIAQNKPHELPWYLRARPLLQVWKWLFFERGAFIANPQADAQWNRGAYLATAAVHCGECHTPRNRLGGFKRGLYYAGTRDGPEKSVIPNITPDKKTGIGRWSKRDIADYLETGATPDGDSAGDLMADVIDDSTAHLTKVDRDAIATYIVSLPPIENAVRKEKKAASDEW